MNTRVYSTLHKHLIKTVLVWGVLTLVLFSLRFVPPPGGDTKEMVSRATYGYHFFLRAPLVVAFHHTLWLLLRNVGWSASEVIALSSAMAGGVYFLAVSRLGRGWRFWLVMLASSLTVLFCGHVENYAWPFAMSMVMLLALQQYQAGKFGYQLVCAGAVLTVFLHPMTIMIWPGLVWGMRPWDRSLLLGWLVSLIVVVGVFDFVYLTGQAEGLVQQDWVLPLVAQAGSTARYTLLSKQHGLELGFFYLISMPLGAVCALRYYRHLTSRWERSVVLCGAIALAWSLVWQPGMSWADWDLFAWPALFVNLAGATAWSRSAAALAAVENQFLVQGP